MTFERWTERKTEDSASTWDESSSGKERARQKMKGGLRAAVVAPGLCRKREPDEGGGAKGWDGAELESGGGLTSSRGPMIEDWGPEALQKNLRVWLGQSDWRESCNSCLFGWKASLCRSRGPGPSPKKCRAWLEPVVQRPPYRRGLGGRFS